MTKIGQSLVYISENIINSAGINFVPESRNAEFSNSDLKKVFLGPRSWSLCNNGVADAFSKDHPISTVPAIERISKEIR